MDKRNIPSHPLDEPQICQTPYRFHAHVELPRQKSYKMLFRRLTSFIIIGLGSLVFFGAFFILPGQYQSYCQQTPDSKLCQPLSMPSFASFKSVPKEPVKATHQVANNQVASLKITAQPMPTQQETTTPSPVVVTSQPIQPAPTVIPAPTIAATETGKYALQVGAYQEKAEAVAMVEKAKGFGLEARIIQVSIPNKGNWYRVQAGRFVDRNLASQSGQQLRAKKIINDFMVTEFQASNN